MCDDGFMLNGQANRTCQDDGIWSGMPPMCERKYSHCKNASASHTTCLEFGYEGLLYIGIVYYYACIAV